MSGIQGFRTFIQRVDTQLYAYMLALFCCLHDSFKGCLINCNRLTSKHQAFFLPGVSSSLAELFPKIAFNFAKIRIEQQIEQEIPDRKLFCFEWSHF